MAAFLLLLILFTFTIVCAYAYNIIVSWMVLCSCRLLDQNRLLTLKFDQQVKYITIFLISQDDQSILTAKITPNANDYAKPLLKLFGDDLHQFYDYLSSPQCQMEIYEEMGAICIRYEVISLLNDTKWHNICFSTQPYQFHMQRQSSRNIQTSKQRKASLACEKQHIMEGIYQTLRFDEQKDIKKVYGHPGWFYNERINVLLQAGRVNPLWEKEWEFKTHHFNVNLNRHHTGQSNKYGLTFGLAHPSVLPDLRNNFDEHISKTISVKVQGQKVYSQCMGMCEWLSFNEHVDPQSLQIYVIRQREGEQVKTKQIELYLNRHKRINIYTEDSLNLYENELERFNQFAIFIYFKRSFLHFNFTSTL